MKNFRKLKVITFVITLLLVITGAEAIKEEAAVYVQPLGGNSIVWLYDVTAEEQQILWQIVEAEATGGTPEQKANVCSCIINRWKSPEWPNTIEEVVFQKKQFSPIADGRYYTVEVTWETVAAVDSVLRHGVTHKAEWFCTPTCKSAKSGFHSRLPFAFCDGEHNYYY